MIQLAENIAHIKGRIAQAAQQAGRDPAEITLVAATKVQSPATVQASIAGGVTCCGENRVQELTDKLAQGAYAGATLHFIGHLQTNKVKFVVGQVDLIQSVDSLRLLNAIEAQAARLNLVQDVLLEVNIAGEENKGGCPPKALETLAFSAAECPHVRLRGLMCVPPIVVTGENNRNFFAQTRQLYVDIRTKMRDNEADISCLSMGMSSDFEDAVREGATHVRVGTALFGPRRTV